MIVWAYDLFYFFFLKQFRDLPDIYFKSEKGYMVACITDFVHMIIIETGSTWRTINFVQTCKTIMLNFKFNAFTEFTIT